VYMEKTFQFPVLERTTGEIKANLKRSTISPELANQFVVLLDESDLVKFSKFKPDVEGANLLLSQGRHIIEHTKPVIVDPTSEDQNPSQGLPPGPTYGNNGKNQQAEVTA